MSFESEWTSYTNSWEAEVRGFKAIPATHPLRTQLKATIDGALNTAVKTALKAFDTAHASFTNKADQAEITKMEAACRLFLQKYQALIDHITQDLNPHGESTPKEFSPFWKKLDKRRDKNRQDMFAEVEKAKTALKGAATAHH